VVRAHVAQGKPDDVPAPVCVRPHFAPAVASSEHAGAARVHRGVSGRARSALGAPTAPAWMSVGAYSPSRLRAGVQVLFGTAHGFTRIESSSDSLAVDVRVTQAAATRGGLERHVQPAALIEATTAERTPGTASSPMAAALTQPPAWTRLTVGCRASSTLRRHRASGRRYGSRSRARTPTAELVRHCSRWPVEGRALAAWPTLEPVSPAVVVAVAH
jgi:hypothetical protein